MYLQILLVDANVSTDFAPSLSELNIQMANGQNFLLQGRHVDIRREGEF